MQMTVLLHLVMIGAAADLLSGMIPNGLIVAGLLCGLAGQTCALGAQGWINWFLGVVIPLAALAGLYWFRMIGAGDIKLLCVIGGFLGPGRCVSCIILTFLFGGLISAILVIKRRNLFARLFYFRSYIAHFLQTRQWSSYRRESGRDGQFCFSLPVLLGLVFTLGGGI